MALSVEEEILRLDVAMGDALAVEVGDAGEHLPEAALDLWGGHAALLDDGVEIAAGAVLHDLAPVVAFVLDKIDGLDNVFMMQG